MNDFMFLNYGGPGGCWLTQDSLVAASLISECKKFYVGGQKYYGTTTYDINGIQATVHSFGIHRALTLELHTSPEPCPEAIELFAKLISACEEFTEKDYRILKNNCVTSVATIMNLLDKNTTPPDVTMPWSLDTHLQRYCGQYVQDSIEGCFIQKYQELVKREKINAPLFAKQKIKSVLDIIVAAYSKDKKEKTKASLLELKWIKEEKGMIVSTESAPEVFREGLCKFNAELYQKNQTNSQPVVTEPLKDSVKKAELEELKEESPSASQELTKKFRERLKESDPDRTEPDGHPLQSP